MKRARLDAILAEKESNPAAYMRDGYLYFEEALPELMESASIEECKPVVKPATKPIEKPAMIVQHVTKKPPSKPPLKKKSKWQS